MGGGGTTRTAGTSVSPPCHLRWHPCPGGHVPPSLLAPCPPLPTVCRVSSSARGSHRALGAGEQFGKRRNVSGAGGGVGCVSGFGTTCAQEWGEKNEKIPPSLRRSPPSPKGSPISSSGSKRGPRRSLLGTTLATSTPNPAQIHPKMVQIHPKMTARRDGKQGEKGCRGVCGHRQGDAGTGLVGRVPEDGAG